MGARMDHVRKRYEPLLSKTLADSLAQCMHEQFPRLGGPRILRLCAELVLQHLDRQMVPLDRIHHGQTLYLAFDIDDPPSRGKTTAQSRMVPVVLDLVTAEDIHARLDREPRTRWLTRQAVRLCHQAHDQGGLLANTDLALLLNACDSTVASLLVDHERTTGTLVPRRANVHDMGSRTTHKRIICRKRHIDGKEPALIAKETYHTLEAVDRYLAMFARVRQCRENQLAPEQIAYTLNCGIGLVRQYLDIIEEIESKP